ncbi:hypothetical protein [Caballeronia sp. LZ043]|uniref:hypothetical protein n=1 Tax=Caballeronia sp. LZ043 TaxID=3038569 RepID=UPI003857B524
MKRAFPLSGRFSLSNFRHTNLFAGRTMRAVVCASVACGALLACTPAYDWRTIMNNDDGYEVTLPAKPRSDEREIEIAGQAMTMRMQTAEANDAVFAVGTVVLPSSDPALQRAALDFLQAGLARNVNARPATRDTQIDLAMGGHVPGSEIEVQGESGAKREARTIHARFVARGAHVYQVAIVGDKMPPAEQSDQFFSSFKLF